MAFTTTTITSIAPAVRMPGNLAYVAWTSTAAAGTFFQAYVDGNLIYFGQALSCLIPWPATGTSRIVIGSVASIDDPSIPQASALPTMPDRRVTLTWQGGTVEGSAIAGFHVYMGTTPGGAVSYTAPVATIGAFPGGVDPGSMWDVPPWDSSPWDASENSYSWTSDTLDSGVWSFAVAPYDTAGNEGTPQTTTATIAAPPTAPGLFSDGTRLHYQLVGWDAAPWDSGGWDMPCLELTWNAATA